MQAINIRQLKHNPSAALRSAGEDDFVVIMNRDEPQALLIDLKRLGVPDVNRVRVALAVALFKQNTISLGYAARIADKTLPDMMTMLVKLGIPVVAVARRISSMIFRSPMRYGPRSTPCGRRRRTADCTFTAGGTRAAAAAAGRSLYHVGRAARAIGRRLLSGADRNDVPGAWLHDTSVEITGLRALHPRIEPGEASSICLAEQHPKSLLIIDDRAGRLEAKARGLRYIGLLGLIVQAKRKGKLNEARPFLCGLRKVGYFMSDVLIERVLREAGEQ